MDPLTGLALTVLIALVVLYALYVVVRAAVRDGIRAARESENAENPAEKNPERSRSKRN